MIKITNKSEIELPLVFHRKDNSALGITLKPKEFFFSENNNMTKSLIIQKKKQNISIEEYKEILPIWMEVEKAYLFFPTDPKLKSAMTELGMKAIASVLIKEQDLEELNSIVPTHTEVPRSIPKEILKETTVDTSIEKLSDTPSENITPKNKGGRPKGALNNKTLKKLKKIAKANIPVVPVHPVPPISNVDNTNTEQTNTENPII